ncbi:MAG: InlB B-repeat-containing protein, partial [Dysgonamonadaceae bacterium]|nr:InlB B-repeat-containing protein [Dysgonamonadaceae bacterium]
MKRFLFLLCLYFSIQQLFALGTVNFNVSGLQSGNASVVSIGSDSYLDVRTVTANGSYSFTDIPTGKYFIKIEAQGYNIPNAQTVIVQADGSIEPVTGINLAITKMSENPGEWTHSWSEDVSNSGYTTTAYINNPPTIEFLGKKIVPANVPSIGLLYNNYSIILSDDEELWTQEYAYRLLETLKTIPFTAHEKPSKFILTSNALFEDITVEDKGEGEEIHISKDAFYYANPFLVNLDGVRGRFFSKRLHHALVNYATNFGNDEGRVNQILSERFGCTTDVPSYEDLTREITGEDAGRFQKFSPDELVSIINMYEELPDGFHKTPHLNYLIRRQDGHKHPVYPEAAAVAWCVDNGYIEFMENAFNGDANSFETLRLILHEKTHFLWAFSFSEEIKNDWIELGGWYKDPNAAEEWSTTKDTEFVSAYAHAKNPDEDMAESVAHYLKNPELLQSRSMPKYEFIRDRIMHGTRYISKIPDHLSFEVLNLHPDYDYPGKIKRLEVKVEGAPEEDKTVTVEIELNHLEGFDDGATHAFTRITSPIFIDTEGEKRSQFTDITLYPVDNNPHILRGSVPVSKYSKSGYWVAGDIVVTDLQGNQRFEGRNDCVWNMYVNNPLEDLEAPKYISGSLDYHLTDTIVEGHSAQNLKMTYHVTDNIGIATVYGAIIRGTAAHSTECYGTHDATTETATMDILITEYYPHGYYYAVSAIFYDSARNDRYVYFSDSPQDEPIKKIYITTPDPDEEAPEVDLNRITVYAEPTNKEAPDGETLVTINYYAKDNKSGLGIVSYCLRDPQGINHFEYHYHRNFHTTYFDGDPTVWEKYTIKCVLPKGSAPGIWGLSELSLLDKAMNGRGYNFVETLIFEPDNSTTDYVLFSELQDNKYIVLDVSSETDNTFGYNYRIINENTGKEISGNVNANVSYAAASSRATALSRATASSRDKQITVDVSEMDDGPLVVIVQIKDEGGNVVAVRHANVEKNTLSNDATLNSLTVNTGALAPAFNPDVEDYTVIVDNGITNITIDAVVNHDSATVSGTGNKFLNLGDNNFNIQVTAENGTVKTYTVLVHRLIIYNINYELNGGVNHTDNPATYTVEDVIVLNNPSKTGYDFTGWTEGDSITVGSTGDKTFTAQWSVINYAIAYELNGGVNSDENPVTYTIEDVITLNNPSKTGYDFNGWAEGNEIAVGSTGDKTFTAQWSVINYAIAYELNGGVNHADNPATYTVEDAVALKDPSRTGYKFEGWKEGGSIAKGSAGDKTFTAQWSTVKYAIVYELNGGVNHADNPATYTVEDAVALKDPSRTGYKFDGWKEGSAI